MGRLAQRTYNYLFLSCTTPSTTRIWAIAKMTAALAAFTASAGECDVAESYWTKFVLYRMESGPDPIWDKLDKELAASLRSTNLAVRDLVTLYAVVKELQQEQWGDEGDALRVSEGNR